LRTVLYEMIYRLACLVATSQSTEHARQRNRDWSISIPRNLAPFRHAGPFFHPRASGWMLRVSRFAILGKQMEKVIPATPGVLSGCGPAGDFPAHNPP